MGGGREKNALASPPTQYSPFLLGLGSLVCSVGMTGHFPG